MRNFVKKVAGIIAIAALVFMPYAPQVAKAGLIKGECEDYSVYSDTSTQVDLHDAVPVTTPVNGGWTASIPGATWIWSEADVTDSTTGITKTFTRTFNIFGTPEDANLMIAADNGYSFSVNGHPSLGDTGEFNYTDDGKDVYVIPAADLNSGSNTITFTVSNFGLVDSTPATNPAGLLYKLDVNCNGDVQGDDDNGDDDTNDNPGACDEIWARINVTSVSNLGSGNMTTDSYVGSSVNQLANNTWFMIHNGTNYIVDPVIDSYENVPGFAVQRLNGQLRLVMHGSGQPAPSYKEFAEGSIEFWNATTTGVTPDLSGNNMLEDGTGTSTLDVIGNSGNMVNFTLQVDTADDGFYTSYVPVNDCGQPDVCESLNNLVVNGGFEAPDVSTGNWSIFPSGTSNLGWTVAWKQPAGAPEVANLEIHDNLWTPVAEGSQYAELDTDFGTPAGGAASVQISQTIPTVVGHSYVLGYDFSPRPGTGLSQNVLGIWINGVQVSTKTDDGTANSGNAWNHYSFPFMATSTSTVIAFDDQGTSDSLGTLLDNVSVNCTGGTVPPQVCTQGAPLYARIKTDLTNLNYYKSFGTAPSNTETPFFVGGTNPALHGDGGNVYMANEWFPLTNADGTFIVDTNNLDLAANSNVPGVAVQRINGAIRVVVYGGHTLNGANKEYVSGSIELSTNASVRLIGAWDKANGYADPVNVTTRIHDATINDPMNPMESRGSFVGAINSTNPRFDNMRMKDDLYQYQLIVDAGSDGLYARYNFDDMIEVPCVQNPQ